MSGQQPIERDLSILRWGGLAGMAGGVLFLAVFVLVGVFVGADPAGPAAPIERFPEIQLLRVLENGLYLAVLALWVPSYLALGRALGPMRPASAQFGGVLGIVALGILAAGALPHTATVPLSDAYHDPTATAAARDALVVAWQTTQGIFDALLYTGLAIMPASLILLGIAMLGSPAFGRRYGAASLVLGLVAAGSSVWVLLDPQSALAVFGVFALIVFHLATGARLFALSISSAQRSPTLVSAEGAGS